MFSQAKTLTDITHPNTYHFFQKERYLEKKIIFLIEQEKLTNEEYQELYLLINLNLDEYPLICKDIWSKLPSSYEAFEKIKTIIQSSIKNRFSVKEAEFVYKNIHGLLIYLPENKMENISKLMKNKLKMYSSKLGYFDDFALSQIKSDYIRMSSQYAPKSRYLTAIERQEEKDTSGLSTVSYWNSDDHFNRHQEAENMKNELSKLKEMISIIRSVSEYNDSIIFQKIELTLPEELLAVKEIAYSADFLNQPENIVAGAEIQNKLNQYLLDEKNPQRITYWVDKGANINVTGNHGMTILGIFLSERISKRNLNTTILLLINLGIDVNIGIKKSSNENNLMLALNNYKPDISDEIINSLVEMSTLETINFANESGAALHYAIYRSNRMDCVKKLLDLGAALTSKTSLGSTPLMVSAQNDNLEALECILKHNSATLNNQNDKGDTALMCALKSCVFTQKKLPIIDRLISAGTNLDIVNHDGKTANQLVTSKDKQISEQFKKSVNELKSLRISTVSKDLDINTKDPIAVQSMQVTNQSCSKKITSNFVQPFLSGMNGDNSRFCQVNTQTSVEQLLKLASIAQSNKDTYRLSQCLYETYIRCLLSCKYLDSKEPNKNHAALASWSLLSQEQADTAAFFIKALRTYALELNHLLKNADQFFWNNFYKNYSPLQRKEIHSFFNLISYTSNNISRLEDSNSLVSFMHDDKINNPVNIYIKELMDSINKPQIPNFK